MKLTHYYFDDEISSQNLIGPVRGLRRYYFNNESFVDDNQSIINFEPYIQLYVKTQPASSASAASGSTIKIGPVEAGGGTSPYTYQWYKNGAIVVGNATSNTSTYVSGALAAKDNGAVYSCKITDSLGATVTTNSCTITVA